MNKDKKNYKSLGKGCFLPACPLAFVGTFDSNNKANVMAAAWVGIINSEPPMMYVSARKARHTYQGIVAHKAFTLSIPDQDQAIELDYAGLASGAKTDKFEKMALEAKKADFVNAPYLEQCPYVIELELHTSIDLGSHTAFIGQVLDVKIDKNYYNEEAKLISSKIKPLVYDIFSREYKSLHEEVKGHSFSIGKELL